MPCGDGRPLGGNGTEFSIRFGFRLEGLPAVDRVVGKFGGGSLCEDRREGFLLKSAVQGIMQCGIGMRRLPTNGTL